MLAVLRRSTRCRHLFRHTRMKTEVPPHDPRTTVVDKATRLAWATLRTALGTVVGSGVMVGWVHLRPDVFKANLPDMANDVITMFLGGNGFLAICPLGAVPLPIFFVGGLMMSKMMSYLDDLLATFIKNVTQLSDADKQAIKARLDTVTVGCKDMTDFKRKIQDCKAVWFHLASEEPMQSGGSQNSAQVQGVSLRTLLSWEPENAKQQQQKELMLAGFKIADVDGDACLNFVELTTSILTMTALMKIPETRTLLYVDKNQARDAIFNCLGVDSSGFIERDELVAWVRVLQKTDSLNTRSILDSELGIAPIPTSESIADKIIVELDSDPDGRVSKVKVKSLLKKRVLYR